MWWFLAAIVAYAVLLAIALVPEKEAKRNKRLKALRAKLKGKDDPNEPARWVP